MEDILDIITSRRSCKSYKSDKVKQELIDKVIKAGLYAPSGRNTQNVRILAITNNEVRNIFSKLLADMRGVNIDPFYNAPVVLMVVADKSVFTHVYDGSCVLENMLLEAHSLCLGACWIHHAKELCESKFGQELLKKYGLENYEGIGSCILGVPEVMPTVPLPRKENTVFYID